MINDSFIIEMSFYRTARISIEVPKLYLIFKSWLTSAWPIAGVQGAATHELPFKLQ